MKKIWIKFKLLVIFCIANTLGRICYSGKYIKGKYFRTIGCCGWSWIARGIFFQKILGYNRQVPWPVSEKVFIGNYKNIQFNVDDLHIFQVYGDYYQAWDANIVIGKGCYIAPNVGIITSNHDIYDLAKRGKAKDIVLGEKCWIGMNAIILPGVKLGYHTIVGAGAVVTKSFERGNCIIAGNPAVKIKDLKERKL